MGLREIAISAGVLVASGLVETVAAAPASSNAAGGDWIYVDHDLAGTRYSPLRQITAANVSQLTKVCAYSFPDNEPSQTAPIVSAGIMYVTSAHYTVALDGADCHVVWSSMWTPHEHEPLNTHRGAALADGKVIRGTNDGYLLALDARDGHALWSEKIADPKEGYFFSMPPLVHGDLVYIGPAGAETAAHGWVGAFRIRDGRQVWRFNIVPEDGEPGTDTWGPDPAARRHGGGNLWTPLTGAAATGFTTLAGAELEEARRLASPIRHIGPQTKPMLMLHSDDDRSVPIQQAIDMDAALTAGHVMHKFIHYKDRGHMAFTDEAFAEAQSFIHSLETNK